MSFHLESELGSAPVPALGSVPDSVVGSKTNPVGNRPVLPHLLGQLLLYHKRLVGRHLEVVRYAAGGAKLLALTLEPEKESSGLKLSATNYILIKILAETEILAD